MDVTSQPDKIIQGQHPNQPRGLPSVVATPHCNNFDMALNLPAMYDSSDWGNDPLSQVATRR